MRIEILLKDFRKKKGITLINLSKMSGISKTHINDLENNYKQPSLIVLVCIAKALNVEITELYKVII